MVLEVRIEKCVIEINLLRKKNVAGNFRWQEKNDLSRLFLANIGKLLKKNKTKLDKISGFGIISEVPKKWTTCRIAEITLKTLELAKKTGL